MIMNWIGIELRLTRACRGRAEKLRSGCLLRIDCLGADGPAIVLAANPFSIPRLRSADPSSKSGIARSKQFLVDLDCTFARLQDRRVLVLLGANPDLLAQLLNNVWRDARTADPPHLPIVRMIIRGERARRYAEFLGRLVAPQESALYGEACHFQVCG